MFCGKITFSVRRKLVGAAANFAQWRRNFGPDENRSRISLSDGTE